MHFRPLHDRVVVRRIEAEEKTSGGIIIPDTAKEKPQEGEVVAVGPGARDDSGQLVELSVKAGDRILFGKWSGTEVKIDGEDLLIMKESDILGVIEQAAANQRQSEQLKLLRLTEEMGGIGQWRMDAETLNEVLRAESLIQPRDLRAADPA